MNSDDSDKKIKSVSRNLNKKKKKKRILEALRYVDQVIIFEEDTPYRLISKLKPDFIVKGGDYREQEVIGSDLCEVKIFETVKGYSTTNIINQIVEK